MFTRLMMTAKLETALRELGWTPAEGDNSVTSRLLQFAEDNRPDAPTLRVPRTD